jgi:hypothetical protein
MAQLRINMVYLEVRFAVPLIEGEGAKLAFSFMHFSKQNPNGGRNTLMPLCCARRYPGTRSTLRLLGDP